MGATALATGGVAHFGRRSTAGLSILKTVPLNLVQVVHCGAEGACGHAPYPACFFSRMHANIKTARSGSQTAEMAWPPQPATCTPPTQVAGATCGFSQCHHERETVKGRQKI